MRIGELSRRTGVSERSLRYYEQQNLLSPQRRPSGYREFSESDVGLVRRIRTLLAAGLNTSLIAETLPCLVEEEGQLAPGCPELSVELLRERDRITAHIEELQAARTILTRIATAIPATVSEADSSSSEVCGPGGQGGRVRQRQPRRRVA